MASIVKRKNKFSVVYTYEDENGVKRQKWEIFSTKTEAKKRKAQIDFLKNSGEFLVPTAKTIRELLEEYVSIYGINTWALSTYEGRRGLIDNYINPLIGNMKLEDATPHAMDTYEMVSGHRRMHAAMMLGMDMVPAIIREMTDDEAVVKMVDANIQREELLPSEKAFAYKMKFEAMKRQVGRPSKENSTQIGWNFETAELVGKELGESKNQVRRYIRLTELIPELLDYVDQKRIQFTVAVEISYIDQEVQKWLYEYIKDNGAVKLNQISLLRTQLQAGAITQMKMIALLNDSQPGKAPSAKLTFTEKKLREYFPADYSTTEMRAVIEELLMEWKQAQDSEDSCYTSCSDGEV